VSAISRMLRTEPYTCAGVAQLPPARYRVRVARLKKHFNTAGPCNPNWHYMVPPLPRVPEAPGLVESGAYFVLHAPRQSGKTTFLYAFAKQLTQDGEFTALYTSCEAAEAAGDDYVGAQEILVHRLVSEAQRQLAADLQPPPFSAVAPRTQFGDFLEHYCKASPRRIVLLLDEIDALRGQSLISVLRQLRERFPHRPEYAPWSVVLCGLRDVRDYKVASGGDPSRLGSASPFNIKLKSLRIGDFSEQDVKDLLAQHTQATSQDFTPAAVSRIVELAGGQPWLVNALAQEVVDEIKIAGTIQVSDVEEAKERLILARATHLDSLVSKLAEARVRRIIEPILAGETPFSDEGFNDEVSYAMDLGLVKSNPLRIANPIYTEVIARVLSNPAQQAVTADPRSFVRADGRFDLNVLLREFATFWVEQGDVLANGINYREASAQLVLMAFLQRVVNGGGTVTREYGIGSRRIDLLVTWPYTDELGKALVQREVIELKVWRDDRKDPLNEGLTQLDRYLDRVGNEGGVLVLFDCRSTAAPIEERTYEEKHVTPKGRPIRVLRA